MENITLFDPCELGSKQLNNRVVMAPMTRTRTSPGDVPNAMMAQYYGQRASAGLIITEAIDVAPHSKGYLWTPGIYNSEQVSGWQLVTEEIHRHGGKVFAQIWHVGRMAHTSLMPDGEVPWGVTDEQAVGSDVFAHNSEGKLTFVRASKPRQISTEEISDLVNVFRTAFKNARKAGFDGVELHAANGYLFEQFMNTVLNTRDDQYGGQSLENRTRFLLEVVDVAIEELGAGSIGLRLSPFGHYNSMPDDPHGEETFFYLCHELQKRGVGYIHLLYELLPSGNMEQVTEFKELHLPDDFVKKSREVFKGAIIWCGSFTKEKAQAALETGWVDMIAFGRPFVGNPDLVARMKNNWPLTVADRSTYYTRNGEIGYIDFPNYQIS
ncbi:MAG: alkene reductase [Mucilaginibacter sp.]|uniref:alkene reductase n=1 Tax=Mucilaginibacter sp. TaxID=1882438 RepID=UPI0031A73B6C